jgi:hypothetical protein
MIRIDVFIDWLIYCYFDKTQRDGSYKKKNLHSQLVFILRIHAHASVLFLISPYFYLLLYSFYTAVFPEHCVSCTVGTSKSSSRIMTDKSEPTERFILGTSTRTCDVTNTNLISKETPLAYWNLWRRFITKAHKWFHNSCHQRAKGCNPSTPTSVYRTVVNALKVTVNLKATSPGKTIGIWTKASLKGS